MQTVDSMRESRETASVAYTQFVLHVSKGTDTLYCFFENKRSSDNAYYAPRILTFVTDYQPIRCGNKNKVLEVHRLIAKKTEYAKYKKAFFVDRDFDEPLQPRNPLIFETPCYSIENFYVSIAVFEKILTTFFAFSKSTDYDLCMSLFVERQKEYHNATLLFNAWYACLKDIRNATGTHFDVSLDDKLPKGFIDFSLTSISAKYDYDTLKMTFPRALEIPQKDLDDKIGIFSNCEKHKTFRGKYELRFVNTLINLIIQDSKSAKKIFKNHVEFHLKNDILTNDEAIAYFSPYAETPDSLIDYLREVTAS